jgi:hypothetical protein
MQRNIASQAVAQRVPTCHALAPMGRGGASRRLMGCSAARAAWCATCRANRRRRCGCVQTHASSDAWLPRAIHQHTPAHTYTHQHTHTQHTLHVTHHTTISRSTYDWLPRRGDSDSAAALGRFGGRRACQGVGKDLKQAAMWYRKAADGGDANAQARRPPIAGGARTRVCICYILCWPMRLLDRECARVRARARACVGARVRVWYI